MEEDRIAFDKLMQALREADLNWIADQVADAVDRGEQEEIEVRLPAKSSTKASVEPQIPIWEEGGAKRRTGRKSKMLAVRSLADEERLALAIHAIRDAIGSMIAQEEELAKFFSSRSDLPRAMGLAVGEGDTIRLGQGLKHKRVEFERLRSLLGALEQSTTSRWRDE